MMFQASLLLYRAMVAPLDVSVLPVELQAYTRDQGGKQVLWLRHRMRSLGGPWVEHVYHHYDFGSGAWDTTVSYLKLDSDRRVLSIGDRMQEGPVANGEQYAYSQGRLVSQTYIRGGAPAYMTAYHYSGDRLDQATSRDTGTYTDTLDYVYEGGRLAETAHRFTESNPYPRRTLTYFTPDSVKMEDVNAAGISSGMSHTLVFRNGNLVRQYDYDQTGQFGYVLVTYGGGSTIRRPRRAGGPAEALTSSPVFDLLGRATGTGTDPGPGFCIPVP